MKMRTLVRWSNATRSIIGRALLAIWAWMLGWQLGSLIVLGMLVGCTLEKPKSVEHGIRLETPKRVAYVQEVKLADGTRCAVLLPVSGGGSITCQWEAELLVK